MLCSKSRNCHIIIVIFTLAVIWLVRPISLPTAASIPLDVQQYRQMAEVAPGLAEAIWSPFHTRILGPLLVWLMPLPVDIAYFWLNQFALVALSLTFFFLLRAYAITGQMAVLLSLAFTLNRYTHLFLAYEFYRLNDSLAMIGLWWGVLLWRQKKLWLWPALVLLAAVVAREIALLWIPVALLISWQRRAEKREWQQLIGISILLISTLFALKLTLPASGSNTIWQGLADDWSKLYRPEAWLRQLFIIVTPFALIPLLTPRRFMQFCRTNAELAVLLAATYATSLFGSDMERLMSPALPFFFVYYGRIIPTMSTPRALIFLFIAFTASFYHLWGIAILPDRNFSMWYTLAANTVMLLYVYWLRKKYQVAANDKALDRKS
jgi:hypothetical protein